MIKAEFEKNPKIEDAGGDTDDTATGKFTEKLKALAKTANDSIPDEKVPPAQRIPQIAQKLEELLAKDGNQTTVKALLEELKGMPTEGVTQELKTSLESAKKKAEEYLKSKE